MKPGIFMRDKDASLANGAVTRMVPAPISQSPQFPARAETSSGIARLLGHRFGDGLVYLRDESERKLFKLAVELGLVSGEGYLTPEGHSFLAAHGSD